MIVSETQTAALRAIRDVIVLARKLAYEGIDSARLAELLDRAEYLPTLMLDEEDRTEEFRGNLREIAEEFRWAKLIEAFGDPPNPPE